MRRISAYYISILILLFSGSSVANGQTEPPDTVVIPLKIRVGVEVTGPVIYLTDKNNLNAEGFISADLNERIGLFVGAGYSDFKYSQYNYEYLSKGFFLKAGVDFNLLRPEKAMGKYWAGIGLRYGLSSFTCEIPTFEYENYWGTIVTSIPPSKYFGHYLEASPGFKAEIFRNFSMGWSVNIRKLVYTGAGKDLRPIYFPGYGKGGESMSFGISYFLVWNIPFKKIKVEVKKEEPEETQESEIL
ncbi:MAG: hypothetical protein A2V50_01425 [Bacteroidetes bacterium RBG_19FT_COMBO_42_10]|nr:MAG: hypothetical protein A2V50_01425 [Bacteroidetes bacterium RBG_19FT_COMBO_42_10]